MLADAVGENGHVDAVDPGAPDYGELAIRSLGPQPQVTVFSFIPN